MMTLRKYQRTKDAFIRVELWPAVQAVCDELGRSTADLCHEDVTALAARRNPRKFSRM
jgi:hypothetical protein